MWLWQKSSMLVKKQYKRMKALRDKGIIIRIETDKQGYWKIDA